MIKLVILFLPLQRGLYSTGEGILFCLFFLCSLSIGFNNQLYSCLFSRANILVDEDGTEIGCSIQDPQMTLFVLYVQDPSGLLTCLV